LGGLRAQDTFEWGSRTTLSIILEQMYHEAMERFGRHERDHRDGRRDHHDEPPDTQAPDSSYGHRGWNQHGPARLTPPTRTATWCVQGSQELGPFVATSLDTTVSTSNLHLHRTGLDYHTLPANPGEPCECIMWQELVAWYPKFDREGWNARSVAHTTSANRIFARSAHHHRAPQPRDETPQRR
jgi:hypothetical protein